jgi:hypothetical protein
MWSPQRLIDRAVDLLVAPLQSLSPAWSLGLFAALLALFMLLTFRYTSSQARIRQTKNRIKAHVLELWLFRHDMRAVLSAQVRILRLNARYLGLAMVPMIVMAVPVTLVLVSLEGWFGYRPLRPGEAAVVAVRASDKSAERITEGASLTSGEGLAVETPALRIPETREVDWRVRAQRGGVHQLSVDVPGSPVHKQVIVSDGLARVAPARVSSMWWQALTNTGEPPVPREAGIESIEIRYPARTIRLFGWELHWLVYMVALSFALALVLRRPLGVEL